MDTRTVCNHIYSYRPRTAKAEAEQTNMNMAMIKAAIVKLTEG